MVGVEPGNGEHRRAVAAGMKIDIWSDVVCPWCDIGKANLDGALERFDHG